MPRHLGPDKKVKLKTANPHITCSLCKGYLIDATTITECLHVFCKSCIVKFLSEKNTCPKCGIIIHQSHPLNFISHDRTMQAIVYKVVPGLQDNEEKREDKFYRRRGLPNPKADIQENDENIEPNAGETDTEKDYHRTDEMVRVCLEKITPTAHLRTLKRKYLLLSCHATVTHLKKYLAMKLYQNIEKFKDVDILCNEELLGKDHTLKFVCVTRWRAKDTPLLLHYRPKVDM